VSGQPYNGSTPEFQQNEAGAARTNVIPPRFHCLGDAVGFEFPKLFAIEAGLRIITTAFSGERNPAAFVFPLFCRRFRSCTLPDRKTQMKSEAFVAILQSITPA